MVSTLKFHFYVCSITELVEILVDVMPYLRCVIQNSVSREQRVKFPFS